MYKQFAYIYDELLYDVNFKGWADYIEQIFSKYKNNQSHIILDMACGTGNISLEMSRRGYDVTGVDISSDMISCARSKAAQNNLAVTFYDDNMVNYTDDKKFGAVLCMLDSVNYILNIEELSCFFNNVDNLLEDGGLFIFDINTEYKLRTLIGNNVFYELGDKVNYLWTNSFNEKDQICQFDLTFFVKEGELYRKYSEIHYEKLYTINQISTIINNCQMEIIDIFDELSLIKPRDDAERIFFICRKAKKF